MNLKFYKKRGEMKNIYDEIKRKNLYFLLKIFCGMNTISGLIIYLSIILNMPGLIVLSILIILFSLYIILETNIWDIDVSVDIINKIKKKEEFNELKPFLKEIIGDDNRFTYFDFKEAFENFKDFKEYNKETIIFLDLIKNKC